eukprot:gb/GFBE01070909.1/.p1 GENE.gb/GFBE01070909.1/~~gb/GFBE01070909.1/.p1  ORF type:complete len:187 (+),score=45.01 gb/GFBE01070909.1/:1-561(+)
MAFLKVAAVASVVVSVAEAALRGSQCIPVKSSCDPLANRCCQGPGLMTCRLRPNSEAGGKGKGMAYQCGEEFPHQMVDLTCTPEGQECSDEEPACCQTDTSMPMTCALHVSGESSPGEKIPRVCTRAEPKEQDEGIDQGGCTAEGESCDPMANGCCQEGDELRTCQLKFATKPGIHGMAYVCAKEA